MADWYNGEVPVTQGTATTQTYEDSKAATGGFGSPAFDIGNPTTHNAEDVEVKLIHRFKVKFGVFRAVGHHVKTITKPNVTFGEVEVPKLNSKVYFAGRKIQDACTIELDDSLDNAVTLGTQTQLQKQAHFDNSLHAKSAGDYFFNVTAEELSGEGTGLVAWYYDKCVVMTCDFGTLDYSDDTGTATVNLSIRYSNFTTWVNQGLSFGVGKNDNTDGTTMKPAVTTSIT